MMKKIYTAIERWNMLENCAGVLVGLSGGADSVTLLHSMKTICAQNKIGIRAVHINHGIRGEAAAADERFCRLLCESIEVDIDVFTLDIPALAQSEGIGLEECGRRYRYKCFDETAKKYGYKIATAHTLSDSAETLFLNITRGCGIAGLRGIPAVRDNVIRPLILMSRDEIEQYCVENSLRYVTDQTNFDDVYSRNRVRLNVIPELKKLNPELLSSVSRLTESAQQDDEYLTNEAKKLLCTASVGDNIWQGDILYGTHPSVRRRAIMQIVARLSGKPADFTHIVLVENMLCNESGAVTLPGGKVLWLSQGILAEKTQQKAPEEWMLPLSENMLLPDGRRLYIEKVDCAEFVKRAKNDKYLFKSAIDCDIINKYNVTVRNRRAGDCFVPLGRGVTKTLKKLFNESHIPPEKRGELVVIEHNNRLIWIEGFGAADGFAPSLESKYVCVIRLSKLPFGEI